jgi:exopolysaccharide production protein ExoZ
LIFELIGQRNSMDTMMPDAHSERSFVANVQVLRFAAAFLVLLGHAEYEMISRQSGIAPSGPLGVIDWGLGVDVFFVISGYIMYYIMRDSFGKAGVALEFLRRRLIRVVPLYWVFTTLMLLAITFAGDRINNNGIQIAHVIASYVFVPFPRADGQIFPILSVGWTLNYEMLFYMAFSVTLLFSRRIALLSLVGFFCLLMIAAAAAPEGWWLVKFWGNAIIGEFLLGIALAAIFVSGFRIGMVTSYGLILLGLVLALIFFQTGSFDIVTRLITGGIPAVLIASGFILRRSDIAPKAWMRPLTVGGDASYALYLSHPFSINMTAMVWGRVFGGISWGFFCAAVIVSIIFSVAVHQFVEKPVLRFLRSREVAPVPA